MKSRFRYLSILMGCLLLACGGSDPEPEEEYTEPACVMAKAIEIPQFLGCSLTLLDGVNQNVFQRLVLEDHPLYDTIYTRVRIDYLVEGPAEFPIRVDSISPIYLICNTLSAPEHPVMWVSELEGEGCD